jgi:hypothetical protein
LDLHLIRPSDCADRALRHARRWAGFALAGALLAGCPPQPAPTDAPVFVDAWRPDTTVFPDTGPPCDTAAECDDNIDCTIDVCSERICYHQVNPAVCADELFCNGMEICDPARGCLPGVRESCDDNDVCTVDRCDETNKICQREQRDLDADGDVDFFCAGGTDCDDFDPTRNGGLAEICSDTVDNDCDGVTDEPMCGRPEHDTCTDPFVVTAPGTYTLTLGGAAPDYTLRCAGGTANDVVMAIDIPAGPPRDLRVEVQDEFGVTGASLRTVCGGPVELGCRTGFPAVLRARSLAPGRYFVIVASIGGGSGRADVTVSMDPATMAPTNETCATATEIPVPAGGTFRESMVGVTHDTTLACGPSTNAPDLFYTFTIPEALGPQDVLVSAGAATGESMAFTIRDGCEGTSSRCALGSPASARTFQLAPGTYTLVVEGPAYVEVDFTLTVSFAAPTSPVRGDLCTMPIPLTLGMLYSGSFAGAEDDLELVGCGFRSRELIHRFTLTEAADVSVVTSGGTTYLQSAIATTCPTSMPLLCAGGVPARNRARGLLPGDYYVIVEATRAGGYSVQVDATSPPVMPTMVSGNDTCGTAAVIPVTGGLFSGNSSTAMHEYTPTCGASAMSKDVAFSITLTRRQRLIASTSGTAYDSILSLHSGSCPNEFACDDDSAGGGAGQIDRVLEPGTYFLVLDAYRATESGDYLLEVVVQDPPA